MLAPSGPLPTRGRYSYEVKWEGFRGMLSSEGPLRIRSRRGWDMTPLLPEMATFPATRSSRATGYWYPRVRNRRTCENGQVGRRRRTRAVDPQPRAETSRSLYTADQGACSFLNG
jgi:hypothetical protein